MATTQWQQQYQQYQQHYQHYQQPQQYAQGQQYQQNQPYQQNQQYQAQQYQQSRQPQPTQQYQLPPKTHPTQQFQQQPQGYPVQQYQQNQQYQANHYQQLQQGQPTQQYQQAQQRPLAQQYPQSQPSQIPQQYPQQQSQQPQQGHIGYPHQFAPHQYPSQQYASQQQGSPPQHGSPLAHTSPQQPTAPQQYGTSQYGPYQPASLPQPSSANSQSPGQAAPQPCFNCGNSGHFAMDCPEPIREIPAGKANPQAFQNPLRRPKPGGTVVTQHQYASHPGHAQVSPTGYPPPPQAQMGYPQNTQHQQPYSPAAPLSAHSPAQAQYYQQWQQYYHSQPGYQQGSHHYQGSPYDQQSYVAPQGQAMGYPSGSQTPSQASVRASQHTGGGQIYQSQFPPASATPVQYNQGSFSNNSNAQPDQPTQPLASMKSQSTPASPHKAQGLDYDFEEDELDSLDVPDIPQGTLHFANATQQPVNLISQPLPGNFVVADALAPFSSPAPEHKGLCRSKYQPDANSEAYLEHFRESKYWNKEHADDVAFFELPADGKVVPVEEILSTIKQRRAHPESSDDFSRDARSQSRTASMNQDSLDVKTTLDRTERELAEIKAKLQAKQEKRGRVPNPTHASPPQLAKSEQPLQDHDIKEEYQTPPHSANFEKSIKSEQDTEDVLAALGVTGAPKPVTATTWSDRFPRHGSPNGMHMSRSRSSSRAEILGGDQRQGHSNPAQVAPEHHTNGSTSYNQHIGPPPPPPSMPFRQQSYPDGMGGSPQSAEFTCMDPFSNNTNGVDHNNGNGNGVFSSSTDGQAHSPIELRSEKSHSRKRHRDSSTDEEDTPKRRQEDDYTSKLKKRQPKVAEAYSRRW